MQNRHCCCKLQRVSPEKCRSDYRGKFAPVESQKPVCVQPSWSLFHNNRITAYFTLPTSSTALWACVATKKPCTNRHCNRDCMRHRFKTSYSLSEFEDLNHLGQWSQNPGRLLGYYLVLCVAELLENTTKLALLHPRFLPSNSCNLTRRP
jgi:hypothetical protein